MKAAIAIGFLLAGCGGLGNAQQRLRTAVDAKQDTLDTCYAKSLEREADGKGRMELLLHISETSGEIDDVTVTSSKLSDAKLEKCVKAALMGVTLDPAPSSDFEIAYTLVFAPES